MAKVLETVLLLALPASGKSEVRKYLRGLTPSEASRDFHMGDTVQLDDFPYVHAMRRIDDELAARGKPRIYFHAPDKSFQDPRQWGALIELVNQDYADLVSKKKYQPSSAAELLFERMDRASEKALAGQRLSSFEPGLRAALAQALEKEAQDMLDEKHASYPETLVGKTLVIEFARGGAHGSSMPLAAPFGYAYSIAQLAPELLEKAVVLYIWVTPEESRRKNEARADPNDPGSILHHSVPLHVMMNDYGVCDMPHLEDTSERKATITLKAHGRTYHLPIARFDNRVDKTSFIREDRAKWAEADRRAVHEGLRGALDKLAAAKG